MNADQRQKLFDHMHIEHGLTLLDAEMHEIELIINPQPKAPEIRVNVPLAVCDYCWQLFTYGQVHDHGQDKCPFCPHGKRKEVGTDYLATLSQS